MANLMWGKMHTVGFRSRLISPGHRRDVYRGRYKTPGTAVWLQWRAVDARTLQKYQPAYELLRLAISSTKDVNTTYRKRSFIRVQFASDLGTSLVETPISYSLFVSIRFLRERLADAGRGRL